jgi:N-acyl-D-amino-acid deacylase
MSQIYDLIIRNASIVDGSGKPAVPGDIAIQGERIAATGKVEGKAERTLDAGGKIVSPGFIDPHSHADLTLTHYPLAENLVMQGITTFVGGNCGVSQAPLHNPAEVAEEMMVGGFLAELATAPWRSFGQFLAYVEKEGTSLNYVPFVGHNVIRPAVMGRDFKRKATSAEIEAMKPLVAEAMTSGAFGISSFFDPSPGEYAAVEEMVELAKVAGQYSGIYMPHTRHTQSQWTSNDAQEYGYGIYHGPVEDAWVGRYRGYLEAIDISRRAGVPLHIAHFSNAYNIPQPHPDYLDVAAARASLEIIDDARSEGQDITFDVIISETSIAGKAPLIAAFSKWLRGEKGELHSEKLKTAQFRQEVKQSYEANQLKFGMIHTRADPYWMDCFKILTCANKAYEGKVVGGLAHALNKNPLDVLIDILIEDPDTTWMQSLDRRMIPAVVPVLIKHPCAMPCTDMFGFPAKISAGEFEKPPAIAYGMFAFYFQSMVREQNVLTVEEAVRKATSQPASVFGLKDRGVLKAGAFADIVIFDIDSIRMMGDYLNPSVPPQGIEYVLVNGKVTYEGLAHTGIKAGKVIRHQ